MNAKLLWQIASTFAPDRVRHQMEYIAENERTIGELQNHNRGACNAIREMIDQENKTRFDSFHAKRRAEEVAIEK